MAKSKRVFIGSFPATLPELILSALIVIALAIIGVHVYTSSYAQTPFGRSTAASGTLSGLAVATADSTASSGKSVIFGGNAAGITTELGEYDGNDSPATVTAFASWLGGANKIKYVMEFLDATSWSTISNPSWFASPWTNSPYTMVWGVPMLPCGMPSTNCNTNPTVFDQVAAGDDDVYYKDEAQVLVADNQASSYIRLGWEFNGAWFPWNTCNSDGLADFVKAFQQIVTSMRSVSGANFKFIWNPDTTTGGCANQIENYYPGDSYVDMVATDAYDNNGTSSSPQARWTDLLNGVNVAGYAPTVPESINGQSFSGYGLTWLAAFGKEHNKQVGVPEWGLWNDGAADSSGDDTYYIDQMAAWMKANASGPFVFWNQGNSALNVPNATSGNNPNSTAEFQKVF